MTPKHLLVHLDASPRADERLGLALALAGRFGALLTGLFAESPSLGQSVVGRRDPAAVARAAAEVRKAFEARLGAAGVTGEWWQLEPRDYGYVVGWTALCCRYADLSIFGQHEEKEGRVPEDVAVVGFDDIREAAYHLPSMTTVRQPMRKMGAMAAETLIHRIEGNNGYEPGILVQPELVVRESTGPARKLL